MKAELLYQIADIINQNSTTHYAVVPTSRHDYMVQEGNRLVKSSCLVLHIMLKGKVKCHVSRTFWKIYEKDIEKVIMKLCRRDRAFAERVAQRALTAQDVDLLIRRSSFTSLKLRIGNGAFYIYTDDQS